MPAAMTSPSKPKLPDREDLARILASSLYFARVKSARNKLRELNIPRRRIAETLIEIRDCGDDRSAVITLFALIDDLIISLMKMHLNPKIKGGLDRLFDNQGTLATASSRLVMAHALRWIDQSTYSELEFLRKIRNKFAHSVQVRHLSDDPVSGWLSSMKPVEKELVSLIATAPHLKEGIASSELKLRPPNEFTSRHLLLIRGSSSVIDICEQITIMPISMSHQVSFADVIGDEFDQLPEALKEIRRSVVEVTVPIFFVNFDAWLEIYLQSKGEKPLSQPA